MTEVKWGSSESSCSWWKGITQLLSLFCVLELRWWQSWIRAVTLFDLDIHNSSIWHEDPFFSVHFQGAWSINSHTEAPCCVRRLQMWVVKAMVESWTRAGVWSFLEFLFPKSLLNIEATAATDHFLQHFRGRPLLRGRLKMLYTHDAGLQIPNVFQFLPTIYTTFTLKITLTDIYIT